jgi:phosphatidylserine decarboxylase
MRVPIARQGFPFIALALVLVALFLWLAMPIGWGIAALLTIFVVSFFRDPERTSPPGETILAPADGRVLLIEEEASGQSSGKVVKISIFMSVFNCHVNRLPVSGRIENIHYRPGKFYAADKARASSENEQNTLFLHTDQGQEIRVVQVAGLIARRIVCWVRAGDTVKRGERFGLIRFGSRVDLYLPLSTHLRIKRGDKVKAGLTVIGETHEN